MKLSGFRKGLLALACMTLAAASAYATPVSVINASFEAPAGELANPCGPNCSYELGVPTGWMGTGLIGRWIPGASTGYLNYFDYIPDGSTVAYSMGGTLTQIVGSVEAGVTYTLQVDWGHRKDQFFDPFSQIALNIGGNNIVATGIEPTMGNWSTWTAIYTGTADDAGKSISIDLQSNDQGDWDNVRLDAVHPEQQSDNGPDLDAVIPTDVPEASSFVLLGTGLIAMLLKRRSATVR